MQKLPLGSTRRKLMPPMALKERSAEGKLAQVLPMLLQKLAPARPQTQRITARVAAKRLPTTRDGGGTTARQTQAQGSHETTRRSKRMATEILVRAATRTADGAERNHRSLAAGQSQRR